MDWNVNISGANVLKSDSEYRLIPWMSRVIIYVKYNRDCTLDFSFVQPANSNIKFFFPDSSTKTFNHNIFNEIITCSENTVIKIICSIADFSNQEIKFSIKTHLTKDLAETKCNFINYRELCNLNFPIDSQSSIIISLTSIPTRVVENEFIQLIDLLVNQTLKPKYVIINLCVQYRRKFTYDEEKYLKVIDEIKTKYSNVIINMCVNDYGPATKILGLLDYTNIKFEPNDRIIVVDDDWFYLPNMTSIYELGYKIYDCDAIFVDERDNTLWNKKYEFKMNPTTNNYMYYDNYQNMVFGWLTFSFKYSKISKLKDFYYLVTRTNPDIWIHDDLIMTLYYKYYKMYACGLGSIFNILGNNQMVDINGLKNSLNMCITRCELEKEFFAQYQIDYVNKEKYMLSIVNVDANISVNKNDYLKNITNDINIFVQSNGVLVKYFTIKENILCLVVEWNEHLDTEIKIFSNKLEKKYLVNLQRKNYSKRQTYFLDLNPQLELDLVDNIDDSIKKVVVKKINLDDWDLIDNFLEVYNCKIREMSKPKIYYRYFCYSYVPSIRLIPIPNVKIGLERESVLIEFRPFVHLEFLIRNTIIKLPDDWSHTVVCGNLNYEMIVLMCQTISPNIRIIKLDYDNLTQSEYSKLLASEEFWDLFTGEKILIYQEDSCIFKSNINDFIEWDYIGAPWIKNQNDNSLGVGNGGFSLRSKSIMKEIINKKSITDTIFNSHTLEYMKNSNQTVGPEDVYFTLSMIELQVGKLSDRDTASKFSSEWINNPDSLGGHCFWYGDINWKTNLFERIFDAYT